MAASRKIRSVDDVMGKWPSISEFARDIGVKPTHATAMKVRESIPPNHWRAVIRAAEKRGISGITFDTLSDIRDAKFGTAQRQGNAA